MRPALAATPPAVHVYVYYRVAGPPATAREAIARMMEAIETDTGIRGRLLCRCADDHTWLEVYEPVADQEGFLATLAEYVARHRVDHHAVDRERHVECFAALPTRFGQSRT